MKLQVLALIALWFLLPVDLPAQNIPGGTVLPVMLNSTLDARHDKPGQKVTGTIRQNVELPDGSSIPKGSWIAGHIVNANPVAAGSPSRLALQFDQIVIRGRAVPITAHLRALASMNEVWEAKMPTNAWDDYGTSPSDWNTVQVGGAGVYRGNGQVVSAGQVVGRATDAGAVTAKLIAAPASGCSGTGDREQSLWVFSPWACGTYGFADLRIAHSGKTDPVGQIEFVSNGDVRISGGSGWLLRVNARADESTSPH
jgi:hypothetical protein